MITSASRRTDIPAFYTEWLMNRIRAGYCTVPNPFNRNQVGFVSLKPGDVDVIVFWTRNPAPLLHHLKEMDTLGLHYYFQYTILDNPRYLDSKVPSLSSALETFKKLSDQIGPTKVIWRYDPIVFTKDTGVRFHVKSYRKIATELRGYTNRSVISVVDIYKKANKRLRQLNEAGSPIIPYRGKSDIHFDFLMNNLVESASQNGMEIVSCAEDLDLTPYGIRPGKCVDDEYIQKVFGLNVTHKKDPSQRAACGCVVSRDIGAYDTCLFGCQYCYATTSFERAHVNHAEHDPQSPSLIGWYEATPPTIGEPVSTQLDFFGEDKDGIA
ncbi:MAG: hypothetical protein A2W36_05155 [Chloroflexi bacterium RBG_16_58_14]|nr:MAG: hypothetical protein A2W36_05155 [Chloroflexi bacterium RBG_16_58_14]